MRAGRYRPTAHAHTRCPYAPTLVYVPVQSRQPHPPIRRSDRKTATMFPFLSQQEVEPPSATMPRSDVDVEEQYIWHARTASQMPTSVRIRVYLLLLYNYLEAFDAVNTAETVSSAALKEAGVCELQRAYKTFSMAGRF